MTISETTRWLPRTNADRQAVLEELENILSSHHFKNSKRYPVLLNHLVTKTLDGHTDQLKERTLGIEVFGRLPDYDTNADPIIRVTAAEIRKRIAQFYHDKGNESRLQIDLPLGSYVPEFKRFDLSRELPFKEEQPGPSTFLENGILETAEAPTAVGESRVRVFTKVRVGAFPLLKNGHTRWFLLALMVTSVCFGVYALDRQSTHSASDEFWSPVLKSPGPVLTVIPTGLHGVQTPPTEDSVAVVNSSHGPYSHISVCDAVALSRFSSLLGRRSKSFDIKEANLTNLVDLHERSAILVGALNNHWTMRLTEPLRFHFLVEPTSVRIIDSENPQNRNWVVDYTRPYAYATHDYAIIARYKDPTTGGNLLIIAGIGAHATQAASEFVVTSNELEQIRDVAPRGWEKKNLEMIVETKIINGDSGPPHLIAATTW
jgi:hypothetical protein